MFCVTYFCPMRIHLLAKAQRSADRQREGDMDMDRWSEGHSKLLCAARSFLRCESTFECTVVVPNSKTQFEVQTRMTSFNSKCQCVMLISYSNALLQFQIRMRSFSSKLTCPQIQIAQFSSKPTRTRMRSLVPNWLMLVPSSRQVGVMLSPSRALKCKLVFNTWFAPTS